jgi:hypothetical protein
MRGSRDELFASADVITVHMVTLNKINRLEIGCPTFNQLVAGSNPARPTIFLNKISKLEVSKSGAFLLLSNSFTFA